MAMSLFTWSCQSPTTTEEGQVEEISMDGEEEEEEGDKTASIKAAFEEDFKKTMDLELGYPPKERLLDAIEEARRMQVQFYEDADRGDLTMAEFESSLAQVLPEWSDVNDRYKPRRPANYQ